MKKSDLIAFGIPEERHKAFKAAYWADVRISARQIIEKGMEPKAEDIQEAIASMIRLIPDVDKLQKVLSTINRLYYKQFQETEKERNRQFTESIQEEGSASECP